MRLVHEQYDRDTWMAAGLWRSHENGVMLGMTRMINERLCYAWQVRHRRFKPDEILWLPVEPKHVTKNGILDKLAEEQTA